MAEAPSNRPRIEVDKEQLAFLLSLSFSWNDIATILGASVRTLQRRASEWGLRKYTEISESELQGVIRDFKSQFPHAGEAIVKGHLESKGIHVQRQRVRESIWEVSGHPDPLASPIRRRTYHVSGPNALWHIDGHHKLIRWRLVVHGGIDGFSRLITYLRCSTNNRSDTVITEFYQAVQECGIPSRVRSDKGGENVLVWQFMEEVRGPNRRSYIAGPSVHNTRIERLWRDVYTAVASTFVNTFCSLEQCGYLDPTNEADLIALHFIFLPRINAALTAFKSAWNSHPLSTEGNRTPLQLFTAHASVDPNFDTTSPGEDYGIDPTDPGQEEPDENLVEVPETNIPLSAASM